MKNGNRCSFDSEGIEQIFLVGKNNKPKIRKTFEKGKLWLAEDYENRKKVEYYKDITVTKYYKDNDLLERSKVEMSTKDKEIRNFEYDKNSKLTKDEQMEKYLDSLATLLNTPEKLALYIDNFFSYLEDGKKILNLREYERNFIFDVWQTAKQTLDRQFEMSF